MQSMFEDSNATLSLPLLQMYFDIIVYAELTISCIKYTNLLFYLHVAAFKLEDNKKNLLNWEFTIIVNVVGCLIAFICYLYKFPYIEVYQS
jgi:hypothetical protein